MEKKPPAPLQPPQKVTPINQQQKNAARETFLELAKIQKALHVPKDQKNDYGGYKYRSCEDILVAVKPLLGENQTLTLSDDLIQANDRFYIKATASFSHNGVMLSTIGFSREPDTKKGMDTCQLALTCSSYARKQALNGLFCIDDSKDTLDHEDKGEKPAKTSKKPPAAKRANGNGLITKAAAEELFKMGGKLTVPELKVIIKKWGYEFSKDIKAKDFQVIADAIKVAALAKGKTGGEVIDDIPVQEDPEKLRHSVADRLEEMKAKDLKAFLKDNGIEDYTSFMKNANLTQLQELDGKLK
ncbi:hypothetical protein CL629_03380 [bacterium]|nr:hypothetical protein [bacterium]|tara:strand:+ start:2829 stop:3728 length:900 start_codon:yes stop_codon:yes gene_type:complete